MRTAPLVKKIALIMPIDHINLRNVLVAIDALLRERGVTRGAARVGLAQSPMSHNVAHLHALFGLWLVLPSAQALW